jgi:hypothetical protein
MMQCKRGVLLGFVSSSFFFWTPTGNEIEVLFCVVDKWCQLEEINTALTSDARLQMLLQVLLLWNHPEWQSLGRNVRAGLKEV